MTKKRIIIPLLLAIASTAAAQSPYDDDIYYDASKDTKTKQENAAYKKAQAERKAREAEEQRLAEQAVYDEILRSYYGNYDPNRGGGEFVAAGDQNVAQQPTDRDVDEYNRRGIFSSKSGETTDSLPDNNNDFAYTQRIERFHDGDIISRLNDPDLVDYYYSSIQQPEINVYVYNDPWSSWGRYGWYDWNWGVYSPYYYPYYSPYWSWNNYWSWNYGWYPSWNISWGWAGLGWGYPSWGWGYPGYYPAWSVPVSNHVASRYTPNGRQPAGIRNGYTGMGGVQHGQLPSNASHRTTNRNQVTREQVGSYRPGQGTYRPSPNSNTSNHSSSGYTPGTTSGNRTGNRNYNSNRSSYHQNTGTYNSGSYNSGSSRGSWGGSSSGGGSMSGGTNSHRGGRR